jgi:hypothetical protein
MFGIETQRIRCARRAVGSSACPTYAVKPSIIVRFGLSTIITSPLASVIRSGVVALSKRSARSVGLINLSYKTVSVTAILFHGARSLFFWATSGIPFHIATWAGIENTARTALVVRAFDPISATWTANPAQRRFLVNRHRHHRDNEGCHGKSKVRMAQGQTAIPEIPHGRKRHRADSKAYPIDQQYACLNVS